MSQAVPAETKARPGRFWLRLRRRLPNMLVMLLLAVVAIISLFPLYWLFVTALTPASATVKLPPELIPSHPTLENLSLIHI